jgi:hypothetical protein
MSDDAVRKTKHACTRRNADALKKIDSVEKKNVDGKKSGEGLIPGDKVNERMNF